MTNEMKVLAKSKPEPGLWLETRPVPEIGPDDVLIKIHKTGICGTDIHIWNWDAWAERTVPVPLVTGHEFAGEIVELGAQVQGWRWASGSAARSRPRSPASIQPPPSSPTAPARSRPSARPTRASRC
ncbi:MAG: alcohol dehydrogenase catalytic domain-containing protein [Rhodospirillales bacterium]|nr:alcohol dehydrogenase catalytic domain-containing protein [Rhodospirillales bacterium]